jgi:hypothetical protein
VRPPRCRVEEAGEKSENAVYRLSSHPLCVKSGASKNEVVPTRPSSSIPPTPTPGRCGGVSSNTTMSSRRDSSFLSHAERHGTCFFFGLWFRGRDAIFPSSAKAICITIWGLAVRRQQHDGLRDMGRVKVYRVRGLAGHKGEPGAIRYGQRVRLGRIKVEKLVHGVARALPCRAEDARDGHDLDGEIVRETNLGYSECQSINHGLCCPQTVTCPALSNSRRYPLCFEESVAGPDPKPFAGGPATRD